MQRRLRLRRHEDFQRVRRAGRSWAHPLLILVVAPNELGHNRYGFITTRKLGNAVLRNRAKRRLRAAVLHWHPQLAPGHDIIIIARHAVPHCAYVDLREAVALLLRRADLLS